MVGSDAWISRIPVFSYRRLMFTGAMTGTLSHKNKNFHADVARIECVMVLHETHQLLHAMWHRKTFVLPSK